MSATKLFDADKMVRQSDEVACVVMMSGRERNVVRHNLTGYHIRHRHNGIGCVVGLRYDAKDARQHHAFVIELGYGNYFTASRLNFKLICPECKSELIKLLCDDGDPGDRWRWTCDVCGIAYPSKIGHHVFD